MIHFFKKIDKRHYYLAYANDENVVNFLGKILKDIDPNLTVNTTISELPDILGCKTEWEAILNERLKVAPSKKIAIQKLIDELTDSVKFDDKADLKDINNDNYLNQFRKVSYEHYSRGENVKLIGLGYLLLREDWRKNIKGVYPEDEFVKITNYPFNGDKLNLRALAEGATIAVFIPYLEKLILNLNSEQQLSDPISGKLQKITWHGEIKEFAELIDQLEKNKWIKIAHGELSANVQNFCKCFDFSSRKKREDSNVEGSLSQYLKPSERNSKIYTKRYTPKFDKIVQNPLK